MAGEIDEALELLEGSGPEYTGGLSNHGPMAAEYSTSCRPPCSHIDACANPSTHIDSLC